MIPPFSRVGVKGADVIFESLLGTSVADPDLPLRCDIMFPDGDLTTFEFEPNDSGDRCSRKSENRGTLGSVGVGGVFTIIGAFVSAEGGVDGAALVSICWTLPVRGRVGGEVTVFACRSGNIDPILDATLPRLLSPDVALSFNDDPAPTAPVLRSGLVLGLGPRRKIRASFSLPTGEGDRFKEPSSGARSLSDGRVGVDVEAARATDCGKVEGIATTDASNCDTVGGLSWILVDFTSGDDVVRYPTCEGCVDSEGRVSRGLTVLKLAQMMDQAA